MKITEILVNPKNSRKHSKGHIQKIADSIKEFGFLNPILIDENNIILAGHARFEAAKLLNLKDIPVVCVNTLTPTQKRAYLIADNKLAQLSQWDNDILTEELFELEKEGFDLELIGFNDFNLENPVEDSAPKTKKYLLTVECDAEEQQEEAYNLITDHGYKCKRKK